MHEIVKVSRITLLKPIEMKMPPVLVISELKFAKNQSTKEDVFAVFTYTLNLNNVIELSSLWI